MMTRKHFEALADAIREGSRVAGLTADQRETIAREIGTVCYASNGRFKRETFENRIEGVK